MFFDAEKVNCFFKDQVMFCRSDRFGEKCWCRFNFLKKIMISLKFGREKRIWQSFLLTNYCNFPRRIFVTGGKHKASKRSDLPLFPSSCLLRHGGRGKAPVLRLQRWLLLWASPAPVAFIFFSFIFLVLENWLFPFAERSNSHFCYQAPYVAILQR